MSRTFLGALAGDGRPLLAFSALILFMSGLFVIVQSAVGHFLPHDVSFLGLDAEELSRYREGRITRFMFHDRVAFGGSIMAVAVLYLWLVYFPLSEGRPWSWWAFVGSGAVGFGSFLTYLGYGYLDTWHGAATLMLLPFFLLGLWRSRRLLAPAGQAPLTPLLERLRQAPGWGMLLFVALGLFAGGSVIMGVGMTTVFVPQDLRYLTVQGCADLDAITPKLVPLIAHDRAAFGGGLATIGLLMAFILWSHPVDRPLWEALAITLAIGFSTAIGIHFVIGYTDVVHLLPAYAGAVLSVVGLWWSKPRRRTGPDPR